MNLLNLVTFESMLHICEFHIDFILENFLDLVTFETMLHIYVKGLWGQFFFLGNGKTSLDLEGHHCKVRKFSQQGSYLASLNSSLFVLTEKSLTFAAL